MKSWENIPVNKLLGSYCDKITNDITETIFYFSDGSSIMVIAENDFISVLYDENEQIGLSGTDALIGEFVCETNILHYALRISFENKRMLVLRCDESMFESFIFEIAGHTYSA